MYIIVTKNDRSWNKIAEMGLIQDQVQKYLQLAFPNMVSFWQSYTTTLFKPVSITVNGNGNPSLNHIDSSIQKRSSRPTDEP